MFVVPDTIVAFAHTSRRTRCAERNGCVRIIILLRDESLAQHLLQNCRPLVTVLAVRDKA